jgi:hypothetical protein
VGIAGKNHAVLKENMIGLVCPLTGKQQSLQDEKVLLKFITLTNYRRPHILLEHFFCNFYVTELFFRNKFIKNTQ